jgi:hypothetical protein
MPIVYEVNIVVRKEKAVQYLEWLLPHIKEMYTLIEGLESHQVCTAPLTAPDSAPSHVVDRVAGAPEQWVAYSISYRIGSRAALEDYQANRAAKMQASALATFSKDDFVAWRRVLEVVA